MAQNTNSYNLNGNIFLPKASYCLYRLTAAPFSDFSWLSKDKSKQKKLLKEQK